MANSPAPIVIQQQKAPMSIASKLFGIAVLVAGIWAGKKFVYDPWVARREAGKIGDSPAAQAASIIYDAKSFWGDNEQAAIDAAKQVAQKGVPFKDVSEAFSKLYSGRNINDYIGSFMNAEQKTKFFNTLNLTQSTVIDAKTNKPVPIKSKDTWNAGQAVIATANVNIRKTPKWVESPTHAALNPIKFLTYKNNVVATVPANTVIGHATGRTSFDDKAEPSGVLFVEVNVLIVGSDKKTKEVPMWVAASQAIPKWYKQIMTYDATGKGAFNSPYKLGILTQAAYDHAASVEGVENFNTTDYSREVIAKQKTAITNDQRETVMFADRGVILGFPVLEMNTGKKTFVQFQSIAGFKWWADKSDVFIRSRLKHYKHA